MGERVPGLARKRGPSCPVCGASFRGKRICPRCETDLAPLMRLHVLAWRKRNRALKALERGDAQGALEAARESLSLQDHPLGRRLLLLAFLSRA